MRSHVQVLTTPTADTPGTTLLLHFDNKRYLIGSLAEGTQRACVQMGARLLKVSEVFITGRTEWKNTGGLIGMILTLADAASSSAAASAEEAKKRALAKGKRLGCLEDEAKMKGLQEEAKWETSSRLTLFSPPNLNHTLATARRFVFRKGMPIDVHEIDEAVGQREGDEEWAPYWADENVKVWAMSVLPKASTTFEPLNSTAQTNGGTRVPGAKSPRKRSIDEMYERGESSTTNGASAVTASSLTPAERDQLTVKAVVGEMFNSSWRLDTLYETRLNEVKLPATIFVRNAGTNKIERYTGPLPGGKQEIPDPTMIVLVRKPWPGALVESLPPIEPRKEAVSYIIRNHTQRGKFNPQAAMALKVEKGYKWSQLSAGNSVQNFEGGMVMPDMVLGESKEGGGLAVVDLPGPEYIELLLQRPEWREEKVMAGVGAIVWICGPGVATDERVRSFMQEFGHLEHVVSAPEYCTNSIALESAAAATVRLRKVDGKRYVVPHHSNQLAKQPSVQLPKNARDAVRGQMIELEPKMNVHEKQVVAPLDIAATEAEMPSEVLELAEKARYAITSTVDEARKWAGTLPSGAEDVEITTLGTGSALPSKYRNVSATLMRVPGWGSMLFDCGENTLGQLKRVYSAEELQEILKELKVIFISHMHADHHLSTVSVIRAWYEAVHGCQPLPPGSDLKASWDRETGLAVVSEPAMQHWLAEYSQIEDYGFSRIATLYISPANPAKGTQSKLGWFIPPSTLAALPSAEARMAMLADHTVQPDFLGLQDIQAVAVQHCHGARAVSITFPSGFKASYSGDCRPSKSFSQIGKGSTVCIHEATFDDELLGDAQAKNHSTTSEALGVAQAMGAKACVLTHFSQRYQKLPVLDHATKDGEDGEAVGDGVPMAEEVVEEEVSANPEDALEGPLEDVAATFPDQETADTGQQVDLPETKTKTNGAAEKARSKSSAPEAVKFKLSSDMQVALAFDYMKVKLGELPELQHFTPALLKLFEEEEKEKQEVVADGGGQSGKVKKEKRSKGQRGNA